MGNFRPETMLDKSLGNPAVLSHGSCRSSVAVACGAIMFLWGHVLISASGGPGRSSVVGLGMQHVDKHCIGIRHHHRTFWSISNYSATFVGIAVALMDNWTFGEKDHIIALSILRRTLS